MSAGKAFPLNLFGIAFGLSGLAGTWTVASEALGMSRIPANVLWIVAAVAWLVSVARYLLGARTVRQLQEDLGHPVLGPFAALIPTTGMLLGATLSRFAPTAGKTVVLVMFVLGIAVATAFVRRLLLGGLDLDRLHAGYLLPTVAAGLIGGQALATVGLREIGLASFGVGILMWLLLGAALTARLAFRPALPDALIPTMAIYSAPPAVAGNAWFALDGGRLDLFQHLLFGTFVLLILIQLALIPTYARLPFGARFLGPHLHHGRQRHVWHPLAGRVRSTGRSGVDGRRTDRDHPDDRMGRGPFDPADQRRWTASSATSTSSRSVASVSGSWAGSSRSCAISD